MANPLTQKTPGMGKSVWDRLRWRSHWYRKSGRTNMTVGGDPELRVLVVAVRQAADNLMRATLEAVLMADENGTPDAGQAAVDAAAAALEGANEKLEQHLARFGNESEGTGGAGDQGAAEEAAEQAWPFLYASNLALIKSGEIDRQNDRAHAASNNEIVQAQGLAAQFLNVLGNNLTQQNANTQLYLSRTLGVQDDRDARNISERGQANRTSESSVDTQEKMGEDTTRELSRGVPERASDEAQAKK